VIATLLFALLSVTAAPPEKSLPAGTLCVAEAPCVATQGDRVRVVAGETPRRYVWIGDGGAAIGAGVIAAGATNIALTEGTSRTLRVNPPVRGDVAFELTSKDDRWQWRVANPPPSIRLIHPVCADCVFAAEAKGFRPFRRALRDVVEVALQPWPRISGAVMDRATGEPLPGATITASGVLLDKSGTDGAFNAAVEGPWPRAVEIAFPGRATRRVNLPSVPGDADLSSIQLSAGGALHVTILPPIQQKVIWELREPMNFTLLRQGTLDAGESELSIDAIDEGKHTFIVRGSEPLQQFANVVEVADARATDVTIAIEPGTVTFEVRRGDAGLAGGKVKVGGPNWPDAEIMLDRDGNAVEEIWQRGRYRAALARGGMSFARETIETAEFRWRIDIPDRAVTGRVVDARTGAPVEGARVSFAVQKGDAAVQRSERTDSEGRFRFEAVHDGTHEMNVHHPDYLTAEDVPVAVAEASGTYPVDIRLQSRADGRPLSVVDDRGMPLPDALVILGDRNGLREIAFTGADGRCVVPLGPEDSGTIFVVPRSGSFAFSRIPSQRDGEATIEMRVRAGTAVIEVEARDPAGKPLPHVLVIPRVNGLMFAPQLVDAFMRMQGMSLMTDANGRARLTGMPPGVYELWAVAGQDQLRALLSPSPPPPAASLEVISGRYEVTLGFTASSTVSP
jgi:hypothetical protein